jgi:hypothetical protein
VGFLTAARTTTASAISATMTRYNCRAGSAVTASQAAMAASKTASNRAQRTDVVLQAIDGPEGSRWAGFSDGCFVYQERSARDAESEPRATPRLSYRLRKPGGISLGLRQPPCGPGRARALEWARAR